MGVRAREKRSAKMKGLWYNGAIMEHEDILLTLVEALEAHRQTIELEVIEA